ncbi:uncharacterized protein LOC129876689 [Solanum dulcamara]|uniref:uncharacterized protein LOC129876689 n=1 Tax=Solanum dulcamara TaxID=45834 RepID=UPI00248610A6|nr:uncharacterized protein LOC129876689 [Solanum dulcamara]
MRCKTHLTDASSSIGVCASCLREGLFIVIAADAQTKTNAYYKQFEAIQTQDDRRKSDTNPLPLAFHPNSVHGIPDHRFYSTPQVGPNGLTITASTLYKKKKKKNYGLSFIPGLFRSRSKKPDSDSRVTNSGDYCPALSSSPSWFSTILPSRRKKQSRMFSFDESTIRGNQESCHNYDEENQHCLDNSNGYSSETPKRTPAAQPGRRTGANRSGHNRSLSGIAFCLSPLVRASPSRQWNQKGMPPDMVFSGEIKVPAKGHLSNAVSFCKNRSRKLADFGRFNPNR